MCSLKFSLYFSFIELFYLFIYSSLIYYIPFPPLLPVSLLHLPFSMHSHLLDTPFPLEKKTGLPETSTKYSVKSYSKTRHIFSHQGWGRQPSRRKGSKGRHELERAPAPIASISTGTPSYTTIIYMQNLCQNHSGWLTSVSPRVLVSWFFGLLFVWCSQLLWLPPLLCWTLQPPPDFGCVTLHLLPSVAGWSLWTLWFKDGSGSSNYAGRTNCRSEVLWLG